MKKILVICALFTSNVCLGQKIDTLYYDIDWKGTNKLFANNYVVSISSDSQDSSIYFKAFNKDGKTKIQGACTDIDITDFYESSFDGKLTQFYDSGEIECELHFINGKANGDCIYYSQNGDIIGVRKYNQGDLFFESAYHNNGKLAIEAELKDGILNGKFKTYNEDGVLIAMQTYDNGIVSGITEYFDQAGNITYHATLNNGVEDGEVIYYRNGVPAIIENYDNGLPVGISEDRRDGSISKIIYKDIKNLNKDFRVSCQVENREFAVKQVGKYWTTYAGMPVYLKGKTYMMFNIFIRNDSSQDFICSIDNIVVEAIHKKKHSENLAYATNKATEIFEISSKYITKKIYDNASQTAQSAATQTTESTSYSSGITSSNKTNNTSSKTSSTAAVVGASAYGAYGTDNSGNRAATVGSAIGGAVGASSSQTETTSNEKSTTYTTTSNTSTSSHVDGYIKHQIYQEEKVKADRLVDEENDDLLQMIDRVQYSHIHIKPNQTQRRCILADIEKKFDTIKLSFSINGTLCEVEFIADDFDGIID